LFVEVVEVILEGMFVLEEREGNARVFAEAYQFDETVALAPQPVGTREEVGH